MLAFIEVAGIKQLDVTGGAPELNPHFRELVERARALGVNVIDRCNLTILEEPGQEDLAGFLARNRVVVTASLPCYLEDNVDRQRGKGVFDKSIRGLVRLNALGYGMPDSALDAQPGVQPAGPVAAARAGRTRGRLQAPSRRALRGELQPPVHARQHADPALRQHAGLAGKFNAYMTLLRGAHRDENLEGVMCRTLVSVDWMGYVYDCDFNQMLGLPLVVEGRRRTHLSDLIGRDLTGNPIAVRDHCYGCTAGQGSSCGGALDG